MEGSTRLASVHSSISSADVLPLSTCLLHPALIGSKFHGDTRLSRESVSLSKSGRRVYEPAAMYPIVLLVLIIRGNVCMKTLSV